MELRCGDGKVGQKATPGLVPDTDIFVDSERFAPITRRGTKTSEDVATHSLCERARKVCFSSADAVVPND